MNICAVVVTHNRRALLQECLTALRVQSRPPDRVLVVDNASCDGTAQMIEREHPDVELLALATNQGGAGGFHAGLSRAHRDGFDWIWLMDDDTVPAPAALAELVGAAERLGAREPALLSSKAVWTDGRLHPMNYHGFERTDTAEVVAAAEVGLMPLRTATFVSLLVARRTIDAHGLPLRRYFLWSDDIEYTARVLRHQPGYLVAASVVVHKTERPYTAVTTSGRRFYFHVRNTIYMLRGSAWAPDEKASLLFGLIVSIAQYLRFNHFSGRAAAAILRGLLDGLRPGAPTPWRP
jgi:GT2 family glycosyltransferase